MVRFFAPTAKYESVCIRRLYITTLYIPIRVFSWNEEMNHVTLRPVVLISKFCIYIYK